MHKYSWLLFPLLSAGITTTVSAQQSEIYTHHLKDFNRAVELYNDRQYLSAQQLFIDVQQQNNQMDVQADCAYYIANCAIRLNQNGADQLMK